MKKRIFTFFSSFCRVVICLWEAVNPTSVTTLQTHLLSTKNGKQDKSNYRYCLLSKYLIIAKRKSDFGLFAVVTTGYVLIMAAF